jgi:hypothetical protein
MVFRVSPNVRAGLEHVREIVGIGRVAERRTDLENLLHGA